MTRVVVLSDVHGNSIALDAVRKAIRTEKPDLVAVAGDLVLNGPDPVGAVDILRGMEADGAAIVSGNTDIAVADFDFTAAFPWMRDGVPLQGDGHRGGYGSRGCAACRRSAGCRPRTGR